MKMLTWIWFKNWRRWCHHYGEGCEKQHESDLRSCMKYNRKCTTLMSTETERSLIRVTAIWLNSTYTKTCVCKIQFQKTNAITQHSKQLGAKLIKFTNCIFLKLQSCKLITFITVLQIYLNEELTTEITLHSALTVHTYFVPKLEHYVTVTRYATSTFHLYYNFNTVVTVYLFMDWHHYLTLYIRTYTNMYIFLPFT